MRLYEGEGSKSIPQLTEREGYSVYWRGVYGGAYLDGVQFEAGATLSYEQLMESLGAVATSLPVAEGGYKRLEVCAYYAPDGSAETDEPHPAAVAHQRRSDHRLGDARPPAMRIFPFPIRCRTA